MINFLRKHKERVTLVGVVLAFFLFIAIGSYLQEKSRLEKGPLPEVEPQSVQLKSEPQDREKSAEKSTTPTSASSTTYFLKPSPDELLEQLASMENLNDDAVDAKFSQLPVLWPAYFFTIREGKNGKKTLLLDVSEDGFGVVLESEVDPGLYPQLAELTRGKKVWIGGKILAVDRAGTGTIYLKTEQLRIGADVPFAQPAQKTEE